MRQAVNETKTALRVAECRFNELPATAPRTQVDCAIRQLNEAKDRYRRAFEEQRRRFLGGRRTGE